MPLDFTAGSVLSSKGYLKGHLFVYSLLHSLVFFFKFFLVVFPPGSQSDPTTKQSEDLTKTFNR